MDPEHHDAGVEERVSDPHKPFIVINAAEGTAREIAERAAAVLAIGNGVGINFEGIADRFAFRDVLLMVNGEPIEIIEPHNGMDSVTILPAGRPGTVVATDEAMALLGKELVLAVLDDFEEEMTVLMPERNYRAMHRLLKANEPIKDVCLAEGTPRGSKHWVQKQDWKQRERRGGRRR